MKRDGPAQLDEPARVIVVADGYFELIRPGMMFGEVPYSAVLFLSPLATANTAAVDENEDIWSEVLPELSSPLIGS